MISARRVPPLKLSALLFAILTCLAGITSHVVSARAADTPIPPSLTTPEQVDTSIGTLKFRDGIPDAPTADKVYDQLDFQRASPRSSTGSGAC